MWEWVVTLSSWSKSWTKLSKSEGLKRWENNRIESQQKMMKDFKKWWYKHGKKGPRQLQKLHDADLAPVPMGLFPHASAHPRGEWEKRTTLESGKPVRNIVHGQRGDGVIACKQMGCGVEMQSIGQVILNFSFRGLFIRSSLCTLKCFFLKLQKINAMPMPMFNTFGHIYITNTESSGLSFPHFNRNCLRSQMLFRRLWYHRAWQNRKKDLWILCQILQHHSRTKCRCCLRVFELFGVQSHQSKISQIFMLCYGLLQHWHLREIQFAGRHGRRRCLLDVSQHANVHQCHWHSIDYNFFLLFLFCFSNVQACWFPFTTFKFVKNIVQL